MRAGWVEQKSGTVGVPPSWVGLAVVAAAVAANVALLVAVAVGRFG